MTNEADRSALERIVALDEELEATHPGWMTGTNEAEKIVVTQEDRDAAVAQCKGPMVECIRLGGLDGYPLVQAFAAHRIAAERRGLERAAEVAITPEMIADALNTFSE